MPLNSNVVRSRKLSTSEHISFIRNNGNVKASKALLNSYNNVEY